MTTKALIGALSVLLAVPAAAQETFFYPSRGQSPDQQSRDHGECYAWAAQQTGYDPASPPPQPASAAAANGAPLRGALRGAAVGAAAGAIAGDAGKGAAIGGLVGGTRRLDQRRSQQQATSQPQRQADYSRAVAACMQGRGYSVN